MADSGSGDGDIHDGLQGGAFHVRIHELLGFFVRPSMVVSDDLELRAPSQEIFPWKVREVLNLGVVGARCPLERPVCMLSASFIQGEVLEPVLTLERGEFRPHGGFPVPHRCELSLNGLNPSS